MPFISKDWRSPGEEWVRYEGGWELKKTISVSQNSSPDHQMCCEQLNSENQVIYILHFDIKNPESMTVVRGKSLGAIDK